MEAGVRLPMVEKGRVHVGMLLFSRDSRIRKRCRLKDVGSWKPCPKVNSLEFMCVALKRWCSEPGKVAKMSGETFSSDKSQLQKHMCRYLALLSSSRKEKNRWAAAV